jgi:hypothetical protein
MGYWHVKNSGANINAIITDSGLAKETGGNLDIIAGDTTSLDGKVTACNTGAIAGAVTANAGTNLNTSALATEAGNLATIAGDTTSLDGKVTVCNTGAIAGAVTANAGTNLNTSALATEAGNLATIAGDTTSVDGKIPAKGQAAASASMPTVEATSYQPGSVAPVEIAITNANSTQSAALTTGLYIITADIDVAFIVAANPTATASSRKLWAWTYRWLHIDVASDKVAAIRLVLTSGTVSIEKVG